MRSRAKLLGLRPAPEPLHKRPPGERRSHPIPAETNEALLEARAARYARLAEEERRIVCSVVTFRRAEGLYALSLPDLREIRPLSRWSALPGASSIVPGVVHYRGELLSLHDLSRFTNAQVTPGNALWVLVTEYAGRRMGLMADDVLDVLDIEAGNMHAVPLALGDSADVFAGMTTEGVLVLDGPRMFQVTRFASAF